MLDFSTLLPGPMCPLLLAEAGAQVIKIKSADEWRALFAGKDLCCCIVSTMQEAVQEAQFRARGLFAHKVKTDAGTLTAVPVPVVDAFRDSQSVGYPRPGEDNVLLERR